MAERGHHLVLLPWGEDPSCPRRAAVASNQTSSLSGGSKSPSPSAVARKRVALIGEQVAKAGSNRRPRGVEP